MKRMLKSPELTAHLEYACGIASSDELQEDFRNHPCPKCAEMQKDELEGDSEDERRGVRYGGWDRMQGHRKGRNRFGGSRKMWKWKGDSYGEGGRWLEEGEEGSLEEVLGC